MLQQLEKIGLVQQAKKGSKGRIITPQGQAFLDNISNQIAGANKTKPAKKETKVEKPKEEKKVEEIKEPVKEEENKNVIKENIGKEDKTDKSTKTN